MKALSNGTMARAWRSLWRAKWPLLALVLLVLIGLAAILGPSVAPRDPNRQYIILRLKQPLASDRRHEHIYWLGTDGLGRDVLSRLLYGARVSLLVGAVAVLVGGSIGTLLGLIAGYCGGRVDALIMSLADIQLAFPFILLAIMFLLVLGPGVVNLILALGLGQWVTYARIARGQTMAQAEKEYVEAAKALGQGHAGILFKGILPNILAPLIIIASFNVASVILAEAALSFLGLGVPPSVPSWGAMLADSRDELLAGRWWLAVFPGAAIMLTVLSFNILGDWLRDFLDPRLIAVG
jgi:peptide/nickel transport system permease protein